jgi:hypothetical protein
MLIIDSVLALAPDDSSAKAAAIRREDVGAWAGMGDVE